MREASLLLFEGENSMRLFCCGGIDRLFAGFFYTCGCIVLMYRVWDIILGFFGMTGLTVIGKQDLD